MKDPCHHDMGVQDLMNPFNIQLLESSAAVKESNLRPGVDDES